MAIDFSERAKRLRVRVKAAQARAVWLSRGERLSDATIDNILAAELRAVALEAGQKVRAAAVSEAQVDGAYGVDALDVCDVLGLEKQ